jgi:exodeoxyribonuclease-3
MPKQTIKLISWNVNGYRAVMKKDFPSTSLRLDADIVGLQETKLQEAQLTGAMKAIDGYASAFSFSSVKKGYSGVAAYSRRFPKRCVTASAISGSTMRAALWNWNSMRLRFLMSISPTAR